MTNVSDLQTALFVRLQSALDQHANSPEDSLDAVEDAIDEFACFLIATNYASPTSC